MGLILWIIFGALAGWIGSMIVGRDKEQGAVGNIVAGIVGAIVGGWIANMLGFSGITGFNLPSMVIAIAGAVLVLSIYNAVSHRSRGSRI